MFGVLQVIVGVLSVAHALEPPVGWTGDGPHRALLDPEHPERGELREFMVQGGAGDPAELNFALKAAGIQVERFGVEADGATNLVIGDGLGRARAVVEGNHARWLVVLVDGEFANSLDPDALLKSVLPTPDDVAWGVRSAVSGGADGSVWGAEEEKPGEGSAWGQDFKVAAWAQDLAMVGVWEGSAILRGAPTRLRFRFENTGMVQVQRTSHGQSIVHDGRWATREGLLRLDVPGGGGNIRFRVTAATLTVKYEGIPVTLYRQP